MPEIPITEVGRRLYGRLLIAFPRLEALEGSWDARTSFGDCLRLEVTGRRGSFRRIEVMQLESGEWEGLIPAPRIEFIVALDSQCAQIVQYEHGLLYPAGFRSGRLEDVGRQPRLVVALVHEFLDGLAQATILLVAPGKGR